MLLQPLNSLTVCTHTQTQRNYQCNIVEQKKKNLKQHKCQKFPGSPVVIALCFHCQGPGLITGQGTKIIASRVAWPKNPQNQKTT